MPDEIKNTVWSRFLVVARQFVWLGMVHIWSGYDHVFFILVIILLLRSLKKILILISAFTIAHSVTLILAGLRIITLSQRVVDPLIALSIVYMAVRNILLLKKGEEDAHLSERWASTFGFGLIHGLGFAGALLQLQIPSMFFVPALVVFNIGIELGQICILIIFIPMILQMDELRHRRKVIAGIAAAIAVLALLWFFQRLL